MAGTSSGAKAGLLAGAVFGIISAIFVVISLVIFKTEVLNSLQQFMNTRPIYASHGYTAQKLYGTVIITGPSVFFIGGLIIGLILGIVFGAVNNRIPGKSLVAKGIIFGIILWIILGVLLNLNSLKEYGLSYFGLTVIGSLLASLAYGYLLGMLYNRFGRTSQITVTEPTRNT